MKSGQAGVVYLVGAGPGDPELLTLRGRRCLEEADLVLYDALANPALLEFAKKAETRFVGKRRGKPTVSQQEIERTMVAAAREGKTVVRLKGGDPFVFGRGGEEAEACWRAGVRFEVVPGVSSAYGVPAYAGIPLTHRAHASVVTVVTGRPGQGPAGRDPDWSALAKLGGTLVVLMGITRAGEICRRLCEAGLDPATPAAAVRWGTTPRQRTVTGTVGNIAERIAADDLRPPGVLIVGRVAGLRDQLHWYERRPLFGLRVLVTRARHQAGELAQRLSDLGADPVLYPTIEIVPPPDWAPLERALAHLGSYDWLVLTSANGVRAFFDALVERGHDLRELAGVRIAAIGPATAGAIRRLGLQVDAVPGEFRAEALLDRLGPAAGRRILIARALEAREILPSQLEQAGAHVDVVPVYQTVATRGLPAVSEIGPIDVATFTSSSTVTNFLRIGGEAARGLLERCVIAAIGPITAATLEREGFRPSIVPHDYTVAGLTSAIVEFFAKRESAP
ncbi:MAG: uroporphyrinogen-III C-methyltransferase [Candidatus Dadabacteria bacterium]|nr:MAG: uroporphyrinogen-III C-methyltransferase [Candidatus Dadabacteria bacterium]